MIEFLRSFFSVCLFVVVLVADAGTLCFSFNGFKIPTQQTSYVCKAFKVVVVVR